jgi:hypothetical protein
VGKREIFMRNGQYLHCEIIEDQQQDRPFEDRTMRCRAPDGREFIARPMYGTWGEVRPWDVDEAVKQ